MRADEESGPTRPSRAEVETLLILHAVGPGGCLASEVAARLGLSPTLAPAVAFGLEPFVLQGLLVREEDKVTLSDAGKDLLSFRLGELGLDSRR